MALKDSPTTKPKQLAVDLQKNLQEAYERGTTSEATNFLIGEFERLRKAYNEQLRALRKQVRL